jgi:hypothetical protein
MLASMENAAPATEAGRVTVTPGANVTMLQAVDAGSAATGQAAAGSAHAGGPNAGSADAGSADAGSADAGTVRPRLSAEAGRVTRLTPDRLAELSDPGPDSGDIDVGAGAGAEVGVGGGAGVPGSAVTMTMDGAQRAATGGDPREPGSPTWPRVAQARPRRRRPRWRGIVSTLITAAVVAGAGA